MSLRSVPSISLPRGASLRRSPRALVATCLALSVLIACGDDDAGANEDGGTVPVDAGDRDGGIHDGGVGSQDARVDAAMDDGDDASVPCSSDTDCSDGLACNGLEVCTAGVCEPGGPPRCSVNHPCIEAIGGCDCSEPDRDQDNFPARECTADGDGDCDDANDAIFPGGTEVCAPGGDSIDEDCDPLTFSSPDTHDGDADADEHVNALCFNVDDNGHAHGGDDCLDSDPDTHPAANEICDYVDNDCDGLTDEGSLDGGPSTPDGLREPFYPDVDGDGFGDKSQESILRCAGFARSGYAPGFPPADCDDSERLVHFGAIEICDGVDNDCDDAIDKDDDDGSPLLRPIEFPGTEVDCRVPDWGGDTTWVIEQCPPDLLWCTHDISRGCTTDATTILNCRACGNECIFACGDDDCDEVTALSAGDEHSCALTTEGNVACWGRGAYGRLGDDTGRSSLVPSQVVGLDDVHAVATGPANSCAIFGDDRSLYCWGSNAHKVLANGDPGDGFSPVPIPVNGVEGPVLTQVKEVTISSSHACAVLESGELYCWGSERDGRLGDGYDSDFEYPFPLAAERELGYVVFDADQVTVGEAHGCLVTQLGALECWGDNTYGQLGDPEFQEPNSVNVRPVPNVGAVDAVAAGYNHTCALQAGEVLCWGANSRGQLGRESSSDDAVPMAVGGLGEIVAIDAGTAFTCALDSQGTVWCWGSNEYGERGDTDPGDSSVPSPVAITGVVTNLAAGGLHACALTDEGKTYCWGFNFFGQLGVGRSSVAAEPVPQSIVPLERSRDR